MHHIWLNSYPAGVQPQINLDEYASVNDMFARTCRKFPNHPAFQNLGTVLSYSEVENRSREFAAWLQSLPELQKGSRVALMLPNLLQYPIAFFGVLRAGMIVVNVNPLYTARELEHQLKDSGAEAIVILENFAHVLEKVIARTNVKYTVTTEVGDLVSAPHRWLVNFAVKRVKKMVPRWHLDRAIGFRAALALGRQARLHEASPGRDHIALLQYTGGTTGTAKGAILTHGNLVANVLQGAAWAHGKFQEGSEIVVTALPLYHIFSLTVNCLLFTKLGGLNVLITNPRDMRGFVKELKKTRFTAISGVNTLFNGLLNTPGFAQLDFSSLKVALGGGAAIHRAVAERWRAVTGHPLTEGYGLTEASPLVACNPVDSEYSGAIGLPFPSTEVAIREDNRDLPLGSVGEICVRGPQVMQGYWQKLDETLNIFTPDGWLRTGDIGVMDERGYVRVTDRKKDVILVSGFNVYPNEVEEVIGAIPGVVESAVVGVPDHVSGEIVKAFLVVADPSLTPEVVTAFCRQHLTSYKVPKVVEFRQDLPKNPVGKVLRRELRPTLIRPEEMSMSNPAAAPLGGEIR
ncbi:MAG: long-chain-fatty-acid--CoA ligase [Terriglobia bacterium]|nr:MAG: long-chain-fatty-acid--CoA ligase [Terriglobia bacterium]